MRKGNIIAKQFANNTVDCFIYAVEKSLDSYKFNLLHNKQLFINQLKSRNLATRIIDEGAIDENSGMNFNEYVAILSGNTDLLDKAKLEKKQAVLESERHTYYLNKSRSKAKLEEHRIAIEHNNTIIARIEKDWQYLNQVAPIDKKSGERPNPLKLDSVESTDVTDLGKKLREINDKARTDDDYMKIGTLFDFRILVRSEKTKKDGLDLIINKFMVEGLDGIKYTYNNGYLANDPQLAVNNFINALERMPKMIDKYKEDTLSHEKDIPVLEEIINETWGKENELQQINEELATLNRKIQLSLKQTEKSNDKTIMDEDPVIGIPQEQKLVSGSDIVIDYQEQHSVTEKKQNLKVIKGPRV